MSPVLMDFTIALGFTGLAALMLPLAYAYFERVPANRDISIQLSLVAFAITVVLSFALLHFVTAAAAADTLRIALTVAALSPLAVVLILVAVWKLVVAFLVRNKSSHASLARGPNGHLPA